MSFIYFIFSKFGEKKKKAIDPPTLNILNCRYCTELMVIKVDFSIIEDKIILP